MSNPATLYRFRLSLSDVDRGIYEELDFRLGMHPSETTDYLLTRVVAYALCYATPGLCTGDEPALSIADAMGGFALWIEIGNPSARRLHKAAKASKKVRVYTYKDPENLKNELAGEHIHNADRVEIYALDRKFLSDLARVLKRDNAWSLVHTDGELVLNAGEASLLTTLAPHRL